MAETPQPPRACPRCAAELVAGEYHAVALQLCQACQGVLVDRRQLTPLLERMTAELTDEVDPHQPLDPLDDAGGGLRCPLCEASMAHFGYMGGREVWIDACDGCNVLWLDPEELGAMSLMYGRSCRLSHERAQRAAARIEGVERRVHAQLLARAVQRRLMRGFGRLW